MFYNNYKYSQQSMFHSHEFHTYVFCKDNQSHLISSNKVHLNKSLLGHIGSFRCGQRLLKLSTKIQDELFETLDDEFNSSSTQTLSDQKIHLALRKFEADSMPGFPSIGSFIYLLTPLLSKLKFPLQTILNTIYEQLLHITELIITQIAHQYIGLRSYIKGKVGVILNKQKNKQFKQKSKNAVAEGTSMAAQKQAKVSARMLHDFSVQMLFKGISRTKQRRI